MILLYIAFVFGVATNFSSTATGRELEGGEISTWIERTAVSGHVGILHGMSRRKRAWVLGSFGVLITSIFLGVPIYNAVAFSISYDLSLGSPWLMIWLGPMTLALYSLSFPILQEAFSYAPDRESTDGCTVFFLLFTIFFATIETNFVVADTCIYGCRQDQSWAWYWFIIGPGTMSTALYFSCLFFSVRRGALSPPQVQEETRTLGEWRALWMQRQENTDHDRRLLDDTEVREIIASDHRNQNAPEQHPNTEATLTEGSETRLT